jgi:hypothetical protein
MAIKKASREAVRLRMALDGPSGSGKSLTSLFFAHALAKHYGGKIGVINSERQRGYNYADMPLPNGERLEFYVEDLKDFSPASYVSALNLFEKEGGFSVVVIDSLSHAWAGEGGALELKDKAGDNSYTAWATITPLQNRMVHRIIGAPFHIISTVRSKPAYVLEPNEKGKMQPRRVGLEPIQRKGTEYEYGIWGSMDLDHTLRITKSDCAAVDLVTANRPGPEFMTPIIEWMGTGVSAPPAAPGIVPKKLAEEFVRLTAARFGKTEAQIEEEYYIEKGIEVYHATEEAIRASMAKTEKAIKK